MKYGWGPCFHGIPGGMATCALCTSASWRKGNGNFEDWYKSRADLFADYAGISHYQIPEDPATKAKIDRLNSDNPGYKVRDDSDLARGDWGSERPERSMNEFIASLSPRRLAPPPEPALPIPPRKRQSRSPGSSKKRSREKTYRSFVVVSYPRDKDDPGARVHGHKRVFASGPVSATFLRAIMEVDGVEEIGVAPGPAKRVSRMVQEEMEDLGITLTLCMMDEFEENQGE